MNFRKRGNTLIEVLFAIFLVASMASVLVASIPVAAISRQKADYNSKATSLCQKTLEAIRSAGYVNISAEQLLTLGMIDSPTELQANTYSMSNVDSAAYDSPARVLPRGNGTIKIEQIDMDLKRVTVTVTWEESGKFKSVSVGSMVANL